MISGFGVDLSDSYNNKFSSFCHSLFPNSIINDDYPERVIELWYMKKNGYELPEGEYVECHDRNMKPEWKAYHQLLQSESKYFNLSLNIYGHCYRDNGLYLLAINETITEKEKVSKNDLNKNISSESMKDLKEFIKYFNLKEPYWHIVSLTC
jgi:PDZ domain-containing secreted protein